VSTGGKATARASDQPGGKVVRAAGGVVVRHRPGGGWELLLVHRPRYDDWSLPKGKVDPGETDEQTALREVEEETGLRCRLGEELAETRYRDAKGRPKVVRYWHMEPEAAREFVANDEIDELRWCTRLEAGRLLTYAHDRSLVARLEDPS